MIESATKSLDVVESGEKFMASPRFIDLNRLAVHQNFLQKSSAPSADTPEEIIDHIHSSILRHFGAISVSDEDFLEMKQILDETYWPEIEKRIRKNPGLVEFFLQYGVNSQYALSFLYDAWTGKIAFSVLPAHFVVRDIRGNLTTIPPEDPCFVFCATDASFRSIRYRAEKMQESVKAAKDILLLGGGMDPVLWTRGYQPSEDQKIVIYDTADYSEHLAKLMGAPLESSGIEYRAQSLTNALSDPTQRGSYDLVMLSGVASYVPDKLPAILAGARELLKPDGEIVLDFQVAHPVLAFDVKVLDWPATMKPQPSVDAANQLMQSLAARFGMTITKFLHEEVPNDTPAGAIFWLKPKA